MKHMFFTTPIQVAQRAGRVTRNPALVRLVSVVLCIGSLYAPTFASGESGQHRAHVHGLAELTLALEGSDLEIELTSPADSIVGFEHKAVSDAHIKAVEEAEAKLRKGAELFTFFGTRCDLRHADVNMSAVLDGEEREEKDHDHHKGHDEEDSHDEDHSHDGDEVHTDISAHYEYSCADGTELESVKVGSSGLPFGIQTINAMWVTDRAQGAAELSAANQLIELK